MQINNYNRNLKPSFQSLYVVKAKENPNKVDEIIDLSDRYSFLGDKISSSVEIPEENYTYANSTINFIGEDKGADDEIETMLANRGINFTRKSFSELLESSESIKSRVELSPEDKSRGYRLVEIDTTKFDNAYEKYGFAYVGKEGYISQPERTENFKEYLKTGKNIYAPVVYINDYGEYPEIAFGDGRHRYAYMRDIKMNGIPVAMENETIKIARKYGLLLQ